MKNIIGDSHDPDNLLEKSKNNFNFLVYTWGELLYAGLTPVIRPDEGIIILEGDIGLTLSGNKTNSGYTAHSEIIIDISTGCFKQIKSEEVNVSDSSGDMHSRNICLTFKEINGDFQINLP